MPDPNYPPMPAPNTLTNPLQQLAFDYIMLTGESVFLTGKAGTGKTTFLRRLKEECPKQMAVLAPTGVAAINAGGVTIHSFFQLPFAPFVPVQGKAAASANTTEAVGEHALISRLRYGRDKRELLQSLDLLVIDEVSMVRADVLDAIDTILRHFRRRQLPFGGVQMLLIGDLYQLPPVVQHEEWQILGEYYEGPFFFHSHVIRRQPPVYVELQTIYRQSDERFIDLLNQVRNNQLTPAGLQLLNSRCRPGFVVPDDEPWITLTTHNRKADAMNEAALERLPGPVYKYTAEVAGEFSDKSYPADETLVLKEGAQVMFLKNDAIGRRYFNGRIGRISSLSERQIVVQCDDDPLPIEVKPETWRNVQYTLNRQQQQVEEKELGSFTQYPLRLAWAVTIHKSQGLTFDRAVIDAAASFSAGQVYVALSRCRSLEGIVLPAPVPPTAVRVDERVQQYSGSAKAVDELRQFFGAAQRQYQQELLRHAFDGCPLQRASRYLLQQWQQHESTLGMAATEWATTQLAEADQLQATAAKFQAQLERHFASAEALPEQDEFVQQRVRQAAQWFVPALNSRLEALKQIPVVSDSKETAEELEEALAATLKAGRQWLQLLQACEQGFSSLGMIRARSKVNIADVTGLAYAGSQRQQHRDLASAHPLLEEQLRRWRNEEVASSGRPVYTVCSNRTLAEIATYLPHSSQELQQMQGMGPAKAAQYGEAILAMVQAYCQQHELQSQVATKAGTKRPRKSKEPVAEKPPKKESHLISFELWQQGKTPEAIAAERGLAVSTIQGHLTAYVLQGLVPVEVIMPKELFDKCCEIIADLQPGGMGPVKEILGDEISYTQIRLAMDWMKQEGRLNTEASTPTEG